jgi:hypothetical protein
MALRRRCDIIFFSEVIKSTLDFLQTFLTNKNKTKQTRESKLQGRKQQQTGRKETRERERERGKNYFF